MPEIVFRERTQFSAGVNNRRLPALPSTLAPVGPQGFVPAPTGPTITVTFDADGTNVVRLTFSHPVNIPGNPFILWWNGAAMRALVSVAKVSDTVWDFTMNGVCGPNAFVSLRFPDPQIVLPDGGTLVPVSPIGIFGLSV